MVGSVGPSVTVWPARSGSHSPADPRSDCGQCPPGRSVRESPADQVAQVQRRGAGFEPGMVFPGAAIAQRDPTSAVVRDLGDGPFDIRAGGAIVLTKLLRFSLPAASVAQQCISRMQSYLADAVVSCGLYRRWCTAHATGTDGRAPRTLLRESWR